MRYLYYLYTLQVFLTVTIFLLPPGTFKWFVWGLLACLMTFLWALLWYSQRVARQLADALSLIPAEQQQEG